MRRMTAWNGQHVALGRLRMDNKSMRIRTRLFTVRGTRRYHSAGGQICMLLATPGSDAYGLRCNMVICRLQYSTCRMQIRRYLPSSINLLVYLHLLMQEYRYSDLDTRQQTNKHANSDDHDYGRSFQKSCITISSQTVWW